MKNTENKAKKKDLYAQRRELNTWEINGIEKWLIENMNPGEYSYNDKTIHADYDNGNVRYAVFMIDGSTSLYFKSFIDDEENKIYRRSNSDNLYQINSEFQEIDNEFNHIEFLKELKRQL